MIDEIKAWLEFFPEADYSVTRRYVTWLVAQLEELMTRYAARSAEITELRNKLNRQSLS